ncbi:MAG: 50S ribosomal protein L25 [Desulfovibrionaceae bacterium]|jgi:large subunit ribosomal protein L25|nr:50S ribosomal protein L25 [Desulfovibrionaceae bacterium]
MAKKLTLTVQKREETGKGACNRLRVKEMVPGIFYNAKHENISVSIPHLAMSKLYEKVGKNSIFTLAIEGGDAPQQFDCLVWELTYHPFKNQIQHVDFYGVDPDKPLHVFVPLAFTGASKGVKLGGMLETYRESVEIQCLPALIPHEITVDITDLGLNDKVLAADLALPEGVVLVDDANFAVVAVLPAHSLSDDLAGEAQAATPAAEAEPEAAEA